MRGLGGALGVHGGGPHTVTTGLLGGQEHRICKPGECDILSSGYAAAPSSRHRSGQFYEWTAPLYELGFLPDALG